MKIGCSCQRIVENPVLGQKTLGPLLSTQIFEQIQMFLVENVGCVYKFSGRPPLSKGAEAFTKSKK